ncbi:MAG: AAA family ATPase [Caldilineaceae bacterium]
MNTHKRIIVEGFPADSNPTDIAVCRSKLLHAVEEFLRTGVSDELELSIRISRDGNRPRTDSPYALQQAIRPGTRPGRDEMTREERAEQYASRPPGFSYDFLIVPEEVKETLILATDLIRLEQRIFDEWNLRKIEPFPRTALNFYGPPGTGKTLAAHALADYIKQPILVATYAQIESKFHGDGPKNVDALFYAAERDGAVLFIDEADSLLSKRLTNVTQGSEQAINSMRSQLLTALENFRGIAIFATNLAENYDEAFETRVKSVKFSLPNEASRAKIWTTHLHFEGGPPLEPDVVIDELARIGDLCGRDIKNAVIEAALRAAREERMIAQEDLIKAVSRVQEARLEKPTSRIINQSAIENKILATVKNP